MTDLTRKTGRGARAVGPAGACLIAAVLAGCADLLPKQHTEVSSPWRSYDEAKTAIERLVPYRTTVSDLKASGVDLQSSPNVQLLTYSEIVLRFPLSGSIPLEKLDRGLRECLEAGKECRGYQVSVRETKRDRTGNFWLDSLHFYRVVDITGWSFQALILAVDDRIVYVLYGGQPVIKEQETNKQPLGPLQGWGDALPGYLK